MSVEVPQSLKLDGGGLIPVIVQDRASGDVLMFAFANEEAVAKTAETSIAHFWSRSRGQLWKKGETSGNLLHVVEVRTDCDRDVLLYLVNADGPACHDGTRTCFGAGTGTAAGMLGELQRVIAERKGAGGETSYTVRLLAQGPEAVLAKITEESGEVVRAARGESHERLAEESADLLYHLMVVLAQRSVPVESVLDVLRRRRKESS